jgi:hypothetical protein
MLIQYNLKTYTWLLNQWLNYYFLYFNLMQYNENINTKIAKKLKNYKMLINLHHS